MKVTIDTQVDSMDDIKKLVHILTNILESKRQHLQTNIPTTPLVDTAPMMNLFSDDELPAAKEVADTPPDFSAFLNLTQNKAVPIKRADHQIEFY